MLLGGRSNVTVLHVMASRTSHVGIPGGGAGMQGLVSTSNLGGMLLAGGAQLSTTWEESMLLTEDVLTWIM